MMELSFHVQVGGIFAMYVEEVDLARIALSCHFALDLLCDKEGLKVPRNALLGTIALGGRRQRNWCMHNLFNGALSHTFGSPIHSL